MSPGTCHSAVWFVVLGPRQTPDSRLPVYTARVIFKRVNPGRPYPAHGLTQGAWAEIAPTQVRLNDLVATKTQLDLDYLLAEDSTYFGDLFAHVVAWNGELFLEDGLHRAVRAALQQRQTIHARVLTMGRAV